MGLSKNQLFNTVKQIFNYINSVISPINKSLEEAKEKLDTVQKCQKYVNTGLDYCYLTISSAFASQKISVDNIIGFDTAKECNNMEYDLSNHTITLKQGKTYKISCNICIVYGEIQYELLDITNNVSLRYIRNTVPDSTSVASSIDCVCIYTPETDCQIQVKVRQSKATSSTSSGSTPQYPNYVTEFGYFIAEEIGHEIVIDPTSSLSQTQDTPIGSIISYMGTTAPDHYLICDGTEYNIADYKQLADFINTNYGSYNYFGGDGTTTFAVPDLRGEFLRGAGTATRDTGTGASVGVHQDGTRVPRIPSFYNSETESYLYTRELNSVGHNDLMNADKWFHLSSGGRRYMTHGNAWLKNYNDDTSNSAAYAGIVRPTNTAVNYCIKYESTNALVCNWNSDSVYSTEEQVVGRWIDGKPLYRCTCEIEPDSTTGMKTKYFTQIKNAEHVTVDFNRSFLYVSSTGETISLFNNWDSTQYGLGLTALGEETQIKVLMYRPLWNNLPGYITFIYTKTTDSTIS